MRESEDVEYASESGVGEKRVRRCVENPSDITSERTKRAGSGTVSRLYATTEEISCLYPISLFADNQSRQQSCYICQDLYDTRLYFLHVHRVASSFDLLLSNYSLNLQDSPGLDDMLFSSSSPPETLIKQPTELFDADVAFFMKLPSWRGEDVVRRIPYVGGMFAGAVSADINIPSLTYYHHWVDLVDWFVDENSAETVDLVDTVFGNKGPIWLSGRESEQSRESRNWLTAEDEDGRSHIPLVAVKSENKSAVWGSILGVYGSGGDGDDDAAATAAAVTSIYGSYSSTNELARVNTHRTLDQEISVNIDLYENQPPLQVTKKLRNPAFFTGTNRRGFTRVFDDTNELRRNNATMADYYFDPLHSLLANMLHIPAVREKVFERVARRLNYSPEAMDASPRVILLKVKDSPRFYFVSMDEDEFAESLDSALDLHATAYYTLPDSIGPTASPPGSYTVSKQTPMNDMCDIIKHRRVFGIGGGDSTEEEKEGEEEEVRYYEDESITSSSILKMGLDNLTETLLMQKSKQQQKHQWFGDSINSVDDGDGDGDGDIHLFLRASNSDTQTLLDRISERTLASIEAACVYVAHCSRRSQKQVVPVYLRSNLPNMVLGLRVDVKLLAPNYTLRRMKQHALTSKMDNEKLVNVRTVLGSTIEENTQRMESVDLANNPTLKRSLCERIAEEMAFYVKITTAVHLAVASPLTLESDLSELTHGEMRTPLRGEINNLCQTMQEVASSEELTEKLSHIETRAVAAALTPSSDGMSGGLFVTESAEDSLILATVISKASQLGERSAGLLLLPSVTKTVLSKLKSGGVARRISSRRRSEPQTLSTTIDTDSPVSSYGVWIAGVEASYRHMKRMGYFKLGKTSPLTNINFVQALLEQQGVGVSLLTTAASGVVGTNEILASEFELDDQTATPLFDLSLRQIVAPSFLVDSAIMPSLRNATVDRDAEVARLLAQAMRQRDNSPSLSSFSAEELKTGAGDFLDSALRYVIAASDAVTYIGAGSRLLSVTNRTHVLMNGWTPKMASSLVHDMLAIKMDTAGAMRQIHDLDKDDWSSIVRVTFLRWVCREMDQCRDADVSGVLYRAALSHTFSGDTKIVKNIIELWVRSGTLLAVLDGQDVLWKELSKVAVVGRDAEQFLLRLADVDGFARNFLNGRRGASIGNHTADTLDALVNSRHCTLVRAELAKLNNGDDFVDMNTIWSNLERIEQTTLLTTVVLLEREQSIERATAEAAEAEAEVDDISLPIKSDGAILDLIAYWKSVQAPMSSQIRFVDMLRETVRGSFHQIHDHLGQLSSTNGNLNPMRRYDDQETVIGRDGVSAVRKRNIFYTLDLNPDYDSFDTQPALRLRIAAHHSSARARTTRIKRSCANSSGLYTKRTNGRLMGSSKPCVYVHSKLTNVSVAVYFGSPRTSRFETVQAAKREDWLTEHVPSLVAAAAALVSLDPSAVFGVNLDGFRYVAAERILALSPSKRGSRIDSNIFVSSTAYGGMDLGSDSSSISSRSETNTWDNMGQVLGGLRSANPVTLKRYSDIKRYLQDRENQLKKRQSKRLYAITKRMSDNGVARHIEDQQTMDTIKNMTFGLVAVSYATERVRNDAELARLQIPPNLDQLSRIQQQMLLSTSDSAVSGRRLTYNSLALEKRVFELAMVESDIRMVVGEIINILQTLELKDNAATRSQKIRDYMIHLREYDRIALSTLWRVFGEKTKRRWCEKLSDKLLAFAQKTEPGTFPSYQLLH